MDCVSKLELERIFSSVRQAVLGFDHHDMTIKFANVAAKSALGFDPAEMPVSKLIPEDFLSTEYENYVCGMTIMGQKAGFTINRQDALTLLTIDFIKDDMCALTITRNMINNLRNSAMGIKMSADRCFSSAEGGEAPEEKHISIFYRNYYSMLRTLQHIDSASLLERGELPFSPFPTDLVKLCSALIASISHLFADSGVNITFTTSEDELFAIVDPSRLEQLLLNLFSNSLQNTVRGNSINLSLSQTRKRIILSLDDNGSGISQDVLSNIFTLPTDADRLDFQKTGSGLGLYIAFGIAQLHKGVLLIESREGEGTRVRVMLPVDDVPISKHTAPEHTYRHTGAGTILTELSELLSSKSYGLQYED